jgi:hypothetical protein
MERERLIVQCAGDDLHGLVHHLAVDAIRFLLVRVVPGPDHRSQGLGFPWDRPPSDSQDAPAAGEVVEDREVLR